jgi:hypothetical protein
MAWFVVLCCVDRRLRPPVPVQHVRGAARRAQPLPGVPRQWGADPHLRRVSGQRAVYTRVTGMHVYVWWLWGFAGCTGKACGPCRATRELGVACSVAC